MQGLPDCSGLKKPNPTLACLAADCRTDNSSHVSLQLISTKHRSDISLKKAQVRERSVGEVGQKQTGTGSRVSVGSEIEITSNHRYSDASF